MGIDPESLNGVSLDSLENEPRVKAFLLQLWQFFQQNDLNELPDVMLTSVNERQVRTRLMPVCNESGHLQRVVGVSGDTTDSYSNETALKRLNRQLQAMSDCSKAMMRAADEQSLLDNICRIICEVAGYRMAWVGFPEDDEKKRIRPVAWAGVESGYLADIDISWADNRPQGNGPSGVAMRTGVTDTIQDFFTDPRALPWRELAISRGYHSSIAMPLKDSLGKTFGILNIYAAQPNVFTSDEYSLLEQLASDLAFGVSVLRARVVHKYAEAERLSNLRFFKSMDRINRAIQRASDLQQMMTGVLDEVLEIFHCERAYLLYPCDPDAPVWNVPMERTHPAYPGALELGLEMEMNPGIADKLRLLLEHDGPLQFGPGNPHSVPAELLEPFEIKSIMAMSIYPKVDAPWEFGIHQCSSVRSWSANEEYLMNEIGLRLADGLTSMLILRDHLESERKLEEAERQFHSLIENLPDCIARFDSEGCALFVNQATVKTFGFSADELINKNLKTAGPGSKSVNAMLASMVRRAFDEGVANRVELELKTVKGKRYFDVLNLPERDEQGRVVSVLGIAHDLNDRKQAEEALRSSEERYRRIVDTANEGVWVVDADGMTSFVNARIADMLGYELEDMIGRSMVDFLFEEDKSAQLEKNAALRQGQLGSDERRFRRRNGETLWTLASSSPILSADKDFMGSITLLTDITERKYQQEQLLYQAHYDPLTGLPNRFLAMDRLKQNIKLAARKGASTALLFLDLDDFKKVNDALGHEVGDQVLMLAANRLRQAVRDSDTVARLGGDEFIVLIQDITNGETVRPVAEKIVQAFQEVFQVMGREVILTASLGIAIYPDNGSEPMLLLRNADMAMYYSKASGRNAYHFYTDSMNQNVARRLQMEEQLRLALGREEFYLEYQPIVEVSSGIIVGVEALLRWHNPQLGEVSPGEFIDVAEQTGLVIDIGEWVIESALSSLCDWQQVIGNRFRLALNISPRQFRQTGFTDRLDAALKKAGIAGSRLELEVTEGILLGAEVGAAEVIKQLRGLGVSISMDDFGTGYASLSYLRNYHFDTLKIDRVFIRDVIDDPNDRELIIATLRMARSLGVRVVAEGVETAAQLAFLRRELCDCAQGYYLTRPISEQRIKEMLERHERLGKPE